MVLGSSADVYAGKLQPRKRCAYKEYICAQTAYDHNAADDKTTPYGNPWQLISVFDGDSGTNVVCEGYSKAFQYLCDLSKLDCISVSGVMAGGTGAGGHMWNVVALKGNNYLVDVTNCDTGTVGAPDRLFLIGGSYADGKYSYYLGSQIIDYVCENLNLSESDYIETDDKEIGTTIIDELEFWITEDTILTEHILVAEGASVYIDEGVTVTVPAGMELNIQHISATPVGLEVRAEAEVTEVDGKIITFRLTAYDEAGKIGEGTHKRCIVASQRFLDKTYSKL